MRGFKGDRCGCGSNILLPRRSRDAHPTNPAGENGAMPKRETVRWKLRSVYWGFRNTIRPALIARRQEEPALREPRDMSGLDVLDTAPVEQQADEGRKR